MPNMPKEGTRIISAGVHERLVAYIEERAGYANLSRSQYAAMILVRWALEGGAPVDERDKDGITPALSLRAKELGEMAAERHGWNNFIGLKSIEGGKKPDDVVMPRVVDVSKRRQQSQRTKSA